MPVATLVIALPGEADTNTVPELARDYATAPEQRGVSARFVPVPCAGHHDVIRSPELGAAIEGMLAALGG